MGFSFLLIYLLFHFIFILLLLFNDDSDYFSLYEQS